MTLSLVICTRNRASILQATFESLLRLRVDTSWELIVVDNGSADETQEVIDRFRGCFPYVLRSATESRPGSGHARNCGWRLAQGELVAFIDDDCLPAEDWLEATVQCFCESPELGFLGGRVLPYTPQDHPLPTLDRPERLVIPPRSYVMGGTILGGNCCFRRMALETVGGYDPRFGAGAAYAGEDLEILARLSFEGWPGAYDPRPLVYHHHRQRNPEQVRTLEWSYLRGGAAYTAKCLLNPAMRRQYATRYFLGLAPHQSIFQTTLEISEMARFLWREWFHTGSEGELR